MLAKVQFPNLARPPGHVRQLQTHNLTHFLFGQLLGMTLRPARLLLHAPNSLAQKTLLPLIPSLGANPILLTERSKIERPHRFQRKLDSLFHRFNFLPWHAEVLPHHTTPKCYLCPEPVVHTMS